jgi:hypothetical protein
MRERRLTTIEIHLKVNSTSWEDGGRARWDIVEHKASAVFGEHSSAKSTIDGEIDFCSTGVGVWDVQTTRFQKSDGHSYSVTNQRGEVSRIGAGRFAARAKRDTNGSSKVEDKLK